MTKAGNTLLHNASMLEAASFGAPLQLLTGFYFAFRFCLTYVAFQSDPRAGTIANLVCSGLILFAAMFYTLGDEQFSLRMALSSRTVRWLLGYLAVSGMSLLWTAADSPSNAAGQWSGMAMEVAIVLLLIKGPNIADKVDALMKGWVIGILFVSVVAWLSPVTYDLRIGDYDFLHPNILGMYCALAFFIAQHLALQKSGWRWCCLALGITLLRTISKTSIVAFLIAESFYLLREKQIRRGMKIKIAAVAVIVVSAFGPLLVKYLADYTTTDNANTAETLTGRTLIWTTAASMAIERPWFGHGFYSFRSLIPAFGPFEPWHAHNELLQQFFEYGLLGVAITIGLYLSLMFAAKKFNAKHNAAQPYGRLVLVILMFAVIHGLTESLNFDLTFPLWLLAALAIALQQPSPEAAAL